MFASIGLAATTMQLRLMSPVWVSIARDSVLFNLQSNAMNKNNVLLLKNFNLDCSEGKMKLKGQRID